MAFGCMLLATWCTGKDIPACLRREIQTNTPNVGAVEQQTQMAESMVTRNAQLAEESIK